MSELRAGSATVDVTPDEPVPLGGYPTTLPSPAFRTGPQDDEVGAVNDDLTVSALAVDDGETLVGIVSMDLLNAFREFTTHVHESLIERDAEFDELVIAGTHTHTAPYMPGKLLRVNPMFGAYRNVSYVSALEESVTDALHAAQEDLSPATVRVGRSTNEPSAVNRRDHANGIDPELALLHVKTDDGGETAVVNYACHPLCLSGDVNAVSADWPGVVRRTVAERLRDPTVLVLNGAAGDVNPRGLPENDFDARETLRSQYDDEFEFMRVIGGEISDTAIDALDRAMAAPAIDARGLTTERRDLRLPVADLPERAALLDDYRATSRDIQRLTAEGDDGAAFERRWDRLYVQEMLELHDAGFDHLPATMQYVGLGPVGILSLPGEAFVRHGLDFKAAADAETLLLAGYANEYVGYIPTLDQFDRGGYEVRTCKLAPEAIRTIERTGTDLVDRERAVQ